MYVHFDGKCPLADAGKDEATRRVEALLRRRLSPADLAASGVDAPLLSVLGVTAAYLTAAAGYLAEDLVASVAPTWRDLRLLAWEPALLRDKARWPVVSLPLLYGDGDGDANNNDGADAIGAVGTMLAHWPLTFADFVHGMRLSLLELAALRFTGPMLVACGATSDDLCVAAERDLRRGSGHGRDERVLALALACMPTLTLPLFSALPCNVQRLRAKPKLQVTLEAVLCALEARQ